MKIFNTKEEYASLSQEHMQQASGFLSHLVSLAVTIATGAVLVFGGLPAAAIIVGAALLSPTLLSDSVDLIQDTYHLGASVIDKAFEHLSNAEDFLIGNNQHHDEIVVTGHDDVHAIDSNI